MFALFELHFIFLNLHSSTSFRQKIHSIYLKKFYGHSQDLSVAMYYHYMDVTETLTVTRNEHIEIVGKGDLDVWGGGFFFSLLLD